MSRVVLLSGGGVRRRRVPLHLLPSPPPRLSLAHCGMSGKSYLDVACTGGLNTSRLRETDCRIAFNISAVVARRRRRFTVMCVREHHFRRACRSEVCSTESNRRRPADCKAHPSRVYWIKLLYGSQHELARSRASREDYLYTFHGEQTESQEHWNTHGYISVLNGRWWAEVQKIFKLHRVTVT